MGIGTINTLFREICKYDSMATVLVVLYGLMTYTVNSVSYAFTGYIYTQQD